MATSHSPRAGRAVPVLALIVLSLATLAPLLTAGTASAATSYPPLNGAITGPTTVGQSTR